MLLIFYYSVDLYNTNKLSNELNLSCINQDYKKIDYFIKSGANINNVLGQDGATPLFTASLLNQVDIVELLQDFRSPTPDCLNSWAL